MEKGISKAERTRQFIIESTAGIFNKKGYVGTSMADMTEATRLTKGSIYGNFENKEEVAIAAFDYNLSKVHQAVEQRFKKAITYHDKLMVYAMVYHSFMGGTFPEGGCPILNTAIEADDTHTPLKEKAAAAVIQWKKKLITLMEEGVKAGEFKSVVDNDQLALSIIALVEGGMMIAKVTDSPANLDKVLKTVELLISQLKA
ncbi:TetR/AcrR family transcriptional regulator [Pedobacter sp. L105]|uniref:TetR/AcrR family transcriptional regulator n=1 Tax=Pedobacter sp. L105 TaxID=1641871 RepID=UPI00131E9D9C|nr:TetR/AcrR family transcriptional regulator [Pedobacter sp. L105]